MKTTKSRRTRPRRRINNREVQGAKEQEMKKKRTKAGTRPSRPPTQGTTTTDKRMED
jgi:hypothetical protein